MKVELSLETAKKMYESSEESVRKFALLNYPELGISITQRVKTFEDACKIKGVDTHSKFFTSTILRKNEIAFRKLEVITEVLNEGTFIKPFNICILGYYPVFYYDKNGIFRFSHALDWCSDLVVPDSLCFVTHELGLYAGEQFKSLYLEYLKP